MNYLAPLEALFPGSAASILEVLVSNSEPMTMRQLAERSGTSHPSVAIHIERFEGLGLVRRQIVGRSHLVSLTESAASGAIRNLANLRTTVLEMMNTSVGGIEPKPDAVIVFGSFARGTTQLESDIDVAVIVASDLVEDTEWLASLATWTDAVAAFAGNPVSELVITVDELCDRVNTPLWQGINLEGIVLTGATVDEVVRRTSAVPTVGR